MIHRPVRDRSRSRLSRRDLLLVGSLGLRSRRVRAALSALGISIGIAAIVGVLGISQSAKTGLLNELGQLGNLIGVQPQSTAFGQQTELPTTAEGMVSRIGPVTSVTEIGSIANVYVYRNSLVPASDTSGISLTAADAALPATLGAAKGAYNGLLLGLGAVALLVGGVGIANVMVVSVLERRSEIGLRRALGATRRHVAEQFLAEAVLLSVLGGPAGTVVGAVATVIYAISQHWSVQIPAVAIYGGVGAALVIGAIAGLYPSMRAARLSPTEALRTV